MKEFLWTNCDTKYYEDDEENQIIIKSRHMFIFKILRFYFIVAFFESVIKVLPDEIHMSCWLPAVNFSLPLIRQY